MQASCKRRETSLQVGGVQELSEKVWVVRIDQNGIGHARLQQKEDIRVIKTNPTRSGIHKTDLPFQEYNKCQAKVDKYQERERTGPNIVKLEQVRL